MSTVQQAELPVPAALSSRQRATVALFLGLSVAGMLFSGLWHGLWRPDEPCVVGICAEMAHTGDVVVPRLNGRPYLEKPPLYYAVAAGFARVFGRQSDAPYRLASLLFAALTLAVVVAIGRRERGWEGGFLAAGILASAGLFFRTARWIQVDMALVFGVTLAMYAYLRVQESGRAWHALVLGFGLALAFLAKGLVGPVLVGAAVAADTLRLRRPANLLRLRPVVVIVAAAVPVLAWVGALYARGGGEFVHEVLVVNNLERFAGVGKGATLGHQQGVSEYLQRFPGDFLPWTLLFVPATVAAMRSWRTDRFISWFFGPLLLLCIASTKRDVYLLPLYPAAACMVAFWLTNGVERRRWERYLVAATWVLAGGLCAVPFAGIFLNVPVRGMTFGGAAFAALACLRSVRTRFMSEPVRLVFAVIIASCCALSVYYEALGPRKDYLVFAREALAAADSQEVTILCPDEMLDGLLPLASGRRFPEAASVEAIEQPGLYAWIDSRDRISTAVKEAWNIDVVVNRRYGSHRRGILAKLTPRPGAAPVSGADDSPITAPRGESPK